ncbi:MAG TPA: T9SS type A sorting domain-containing protein, partial [Bacteroidota bacterium]
RQTVGLAVGGDGSLYAADTRGLLRSSPDLSTWSETLAGYVRALAAGRSGELYAATPDSVLRTTDNGRSWSLLRTGGPNDFFSLVVTSAGSVFLGDRYGVLRSSEGDTTWTRVLAAGVVSALLHIPATGDLFAYEDSLIYSSADSGTSWTARPLDSAGVFVYALAGDSAGNLFAGTSGYGLYRSTDRGASWHRLMNSLSTLDVVAVAADSAGRIYAGLRSGLMYSDDRGESWRVLSSSALVPQVYDIAVASGDRLYAATAFGLLASTDRGLTWRMLAPRPGVDRIYQLTLAPDDWLYALTTAGVHRSHDGGNSWTPANEGFCAFIPFYLTVDPGGLLFGGAGRDNFRSTDQGTSWQRFSVGPAPEGAGVNDLLATPSGRVIAATDSGVFASTDHGRSWSRVDSGLTNTPRVLSRAPDGTLFAGCLGSAAALGPGHLPPAGTVYASVDSGYHWRELSAWTSINEPVEVTSFAFADSGTVLAGTSAGSIFRSSDRGLTWSELFGGAQVNAMATDSQRFCYAGGYATLYRSTDDGRTWDPYSPGIGYLPDPVTSIVVDRTGTMLFASGSRIYRSAVPLKEMPDAVTLGTPANGAAAAPDSTRFAWHPSGPAVQRYWFEISGDSLFTASAVDSLLTDTSYTVHGLSLGVRYWWRVRALNRMGWGPFSSTWSFAVGTEAADERPALPARYALYQNYPNPFNPTTTLRYDLPHESTVSLGLFNALGQQVRLLAEGRKPAGSYSVVLDASRLPSGVYFCRMIAGPYRATRKLAVVK